MLNKLRFPSYRSKFLQETPNLRPRACIIEMGYSFHLRSHQLPNRIQKAFDVAMRAGRRTMMKMIILVASILTGLALPVPAHALDLNAPIDLMRCQHALDSFEQAMNNYMAAKFGLDRAIQLLGSARFASSVGKMKIDLASRQAQAEAALSQYIESIGPAYGAVSLVNANCDAVAVRQTAHVSPTAQFKARVDENISKLLHGGVDKLADEQMADIKEMFDNMKARQK